MEDPIKYPSVQIDGSDYVMRFTCGMAWDLEDEKLSLADISSGSWKKMMAVVHKAVGTVDPTTRKWKHIDMTPKEFADSVSLLEVQSMLAAFTAAIAKAQPPQATKTETAAALNQSTVQ